MTITPALLEAYLSCTTKPWLMSHRGEVGDSNIPSARSETELYRFAGTNRLIAQVRPSECIVAPNLEALRSSKWQLATEVLARMTQLESLIHAAERIPPGQGKRGMVIPIRFVSSNKISRNAKLLLAFDAIVLSEALGKDIPQGKIVHGDTYAVRKINVSSLRGEVREHVAKLTALLSSPSPPELVLNRHCTECEFQAHCRQKAVQKDDLSLLVGMTGRERRALHEKGIFTVTQLSYTFRPRRRPRRLQGKKYNHALRALAIRERKIHLAGSPELRIPGTPVFLDVEGVPDRDFYYLIGVHIGNREQPVVHSLWADDASGEKKLWHEFLEILKAVNNPVLVHYGSYESTFLKRMCLRYGLPRRESPAVKAVKNPINLLSTIFAQVYFPTFSNSLKEIGHYLGAQWAGPIGTGWQSLAARLDWERTRSSECKAALLAYNLEDCAATALVAFQLSEILRDAKERADIAHAESPRKATTEVGAEVHCAFEAILESAQHRYSRSRIKLLIGETAHLQVQHRRPKRRSARSLPAAKGRTVRVPRRRICPRDTGHKLTASSRTSKHAIVDLVFSKAGCRKSIIRYVGQMARCSLCCGVYAPPALLRIRNQLFGSGFEAWVVYQRLVLRMSYRLISKAVFDLFAEHLSVQTVAAILERYADRYRRTEEILLRKLLEGPLVHIDETKINIQGADQYVWVLTDNSRVIFRLRPNREANFLKLLLAGFNGTLVSDFYGGYDALPCRQQKCLVHLVRDMNDDLWKNPFDCEYEQFVLAVRDLLMPIVADAQRFGLNTRHFAKHVKRVDRFYRAAIDEKASAGETTARYRKRFERYRNSLFSFLKADGIPWHNNAAERALRHLAVQRKISGAFGEKGAVQYLRMLSIAQSCRFQGKSFLGFMLSKCTDVDEYRERGRAHPDWAD